MKTIGFVLIFISLNIAFAQEAKVIQLDPKDTGEAKQAWAELQKAETRWRAVKESIKCKYLVVRPSKAGNVFDPGELQLYRPGWGSDFEFSEDFKTIVPKPEPKKDKYIGPPWMGEIITR